MQKPPAKYQQRYHILTVKGIAPGSILPQIELKIPEDWRYAEGILFSATQSGDPARSHIIGLLTLHINGKRTNLLQDYPVRVKAFKDQKRKFKMLRFKEPLIANTLIQAYFEDTSGFSVGRYDLKIYLYGTHKNKTNC